MLEGEGERWRESESEKEQDFSIQMLSILCINLENEGEMACAQNALYVCYSPLSNIRVAKA